MRRLSLPAILSLVALPLVLLPSAVAPGDLAEPHECADVVDVNCIHYHREMWIDLAEGDFWVNAVGNYCGLYLDAGDHHRGDPCEHTPVEIPVSRLVQIKGGALP